MKVSCLYTERNSLIRHDFFNSSKVAPKSASRTDSSSDRSTQIEMHEGFNGTLGEQEKVRNRLDLVSRKESRVCTVIYEVS